VYVERKRWLNLSPLARHTGSRKTSRSGLNESEPWIPLVSSGHLVDESDLDITAKCILGLILDRDDAQETPQERAEAAVRMLRGAAEEIAFVASAIEARFVKADQRDVDQDGRDSAS
jgi:hypothetical protein